MTSLTRTLEFGLGGIWLAEHTLRSVGAGLAIFSNEGRLTQVDDRTIELLELDDGTSDHRLDDARWAAVHLDGAPVDVWSDPIQMALGVRSSTVTDVIGIATAQGDTRWLAVTALPLAGFDGTTQAVLASLVEVTGIVRDRAAVDMAEELGRAAFEHSSVPTCVVDDERRLVEWNRAFADCVDRPDYELLSTSLSKWIVDDTVIDRALDTSTSDPVTTSWATGHGVRVRAWRCDELGGGKTMVELSHDATALAHDDGEHLTGGVAGLRVDRTGRILRANAAFGDLVGVPADKLPGNRADLFLSGLPEGVFGAGENVTPSVEGMQRLTCRVSRLGATDVLADLRLISVEADLLITVAERSTRVVMRDVTNAA